MLTFIGAIIIGLILGVLARFILPGRQNIPMWLTILVGVVAAVLGNVVAGWLGVRETPGIDWIRHGIQLVFAIVGIAIVAGVYANRGVRS